MISVVNHQQPLSGNKKIMKQFYKILFGFFLLVNTFNANAQMNTNPLKVVVFAPVYLDSIFEGANYKLGNNNLSKSVLPGLDFYNGIMLAVDSLNMEKQSLEILFFDTKNGDESIEMILEKNELQNVSLIIASFNNRAEIKSIADFALIKNIPLISMTYPNDGGLVGNPFFALVNPTLTTHIEAIYKYIHRVFPTENITILKRKGATEDMITNHFLKMNKNTAGLPLKIKTIELMDSFSTDQVTQQLDSTKQNIILCASLNESFGNNLVKATASNKNYKTIVIGMPTWDGIKDIGKDAEIIYTSPYNYARTDYLGLKITNSYRNKFFGRPTDMVFKGFEAMYHFGKLLLKYKNNLINHLSDKEFKLFNEYDFQPIKLKNTNSLPDYLENKKLYFIRKVDTQIRSTY